MKRNFSLLKKINQYIIKWFIAFLPVNLILLILLLIISMIHKSADINISVLRIVMIILITISAGICSYIFKRLSKLKGYISGIITFVVYSVIKLIMSLCSGGIGGNNVMIYICIVCASMLGGILSANKKKKY